MYNVNPIVQFSANDISKICHVIAHGYKSRNAEITSEIPLSKVVNPLSFSSLDISVTN